jgi:hypothetical protein
MLAPLPAMFRLAVAGKVPISGGFHQTGKPEPITRLRFRARANPLSKTQATIILLSDIDLFFNWSL